MGNVLNFAVYGTNPDISSLPKLVENMFEKSADNIVFQQLDNDMGIAEITIHLKDQTIIRMVTDNTSEKIKSQIDGMQNFYKSTNMENANLLHSIMLQISYLKSVVGVVFEETDNDNRTEYIISKIFDIAKHLEGLVYTPSQSLYTAGQKELISINGTSSYTRYLPKIYTRTRISKSNKLAVNPDKARKNKSISILKSRGIPYLDLLPNEYLEVETGKRNTTEIAQRLIALFAVSMYAESVCINRNILESRKYLDILDKKFSVIDYLTPLEFSFVSSPEPSYKKCIQLSWKYECCSVFLWALGYIKLPFPNTVADVTKITELMYWFSDVDDIITNSRPIAFKRILDMADVTYRMDWACTEARINKHDVAANLDPGVIRERHYAFNWLIAPSNGLNWDDTQIRT